MAWIERPKSIKELCAIVKDIPRSQRDFLAGGTDWMVKKSKELRSDFTVVDMSNVRELYGIDVTDKYLRIGAMQTMTSIHTSEHVKKYASALYDAAYFMGSVQIRNMATLGGNVANASPAADTPPALASLETIVVAASPEGERRCSIEEIILNSGKSALGCDEFIKCFEIPISKNRVSAFKKIGSRSEMSIARLNMAISAEYDKFHFASVRLYIGTLGHPAQGCAHSEAAIEKGGESCLDMLKKALADFTEEKIPGRATLPYKRSAIQALGEDTFSLLESRAKGGYAI